MEDFTRYASRQPPAMSARRTSSRNCDEQAAEASHHSKHHALGQEHPDDAQTAGPERRADGDSALARQIPGKQEVRDVGETIASTNAVAPQKITIVLAAQLARPSSPGRDRRASRSSKRSPTSAPDKPLSSIFAWSSQYAWTKPGDHVRVPFARGLERARHPHVDVRLG